MMPRLGTAAWLLMVAATTLFGAARPAPAQHTTLPASLVKVSKDSIVIKMQLQEAVLQSQNALAILEGASEVASREDLQDARQAAANAYVLIRAARAGIELVKASKRFGNPMLDYEYKELTDAWNRARPPVDRFVDGISTRQYIEEAISGLQDSIRIVNSLLPLVR